jgi:hypothetical protein
MVKFLNEENLIFEIPKSIISSQVKPKIENKVLPGIQESQKNVKKSKFNELKQYNKNSNDCNKKPASPIKNSSSNNSSVKNISLHKSKEYNKNAEETTDKIFKSDNKEINDEPNREETNNDFNLIKDNINITVNSSSSFGKSIIPKQSVTPEILYNDDVNIQNKFSSLINNDPINKKPLFDDKFQETIYKKYEEKKGLIRIVEKFIIRKYIEFSYNDKNKDSIVEISSIDEFSLIYNDQNIKSKICSLKEKYNLHGVRGIRGDGNCLYRSYLFLFFEKLFKLIIEGDIIGIIYLKKLIIDILSVDLKKYNHFLQHFTNKLKTNIEHGKEVCLSVLKLIIELNDEDKIKKEDLYKFFLINYAQNHPFENYLICWLRSYIQNYLHGKSQKINDGLPLYYLIDKVNTEVEYNNYLNNNILQYGVEGETIVTFIFPFLFGVDGKIINITKSNDKIHFDEYDTVNFARRKLNYISENEEYLCNELMKRKISISIFHRENHFDALYDEEMYYWVKKIEQTLPGFEFKYQLN